MKEIVVISGKGGTGKTSVCAALAYIKANELVLADCDVDAADLHLIFRPKVHKDEPFFSGVKAVVDPASCTNCGKCAQVCRFDAVRQDEDAHFVDLLDCEGCGYCALICPVNAITMPKQKVGRVFGSEARTGTPMAHARLDIGADNSGKLVTKVKSDSKALATEHSRELILVDGSPGIGCPVIASLSGADLALMVTEPSISGLEDLKRVCELGSKFDLKMACVINKTDINPRIATEIRNTMKQRNIPILMELPYSNDFSEAISLGQTLTEYNPSQWQALFEQLWEKILKEI
ncbi:MAG TPA: 4Fe-4S binding protein [Candidatus Cloacimonetes bacterium]|jgi:MinD superfamily P-loop ATPase|nr:(4Fe-4S)-binding protein [Candidatus Cloacimonas sp.]HHZ15017.1 4Fe-4S binding protein [Candidatus Cloacimonadota bacterium]